MIRWDNVRSFLRPYRELSIGRIFIAIFLLRFLLIFFSIRYPSGGLLTDSIEYLRLSDALKTSGSYLVPDQLNLDLVRTPGYPVFLAILLPVQAINFSAVTFVQLMLSGLSGLFLFSMLHGQGYTIAGAVTGLLVMLSPNSTLWSLSILSESFFTFLLVLALLATVGFILRRKYWILSLAFFLMGAANYVRPIGVGLIVLWPLTVFYSFLLLEKSGPDWKILIVSLVTSLLCMMPWVIRNAAIHGEWTFSNVGRKTIAGFNAAEVVSRATGVNRNEAVSDLDDDSNSADLMIWIMKNYPREFLKSQTMGITRTVVGMELGTWEKFIGENEYGGSGFLDSLFREGPRAAFRTLFSDKQSSNSEWLLFLMLISLVHSIAIYLLAFFGLASFKAYSTNWQHVFALTFVTILFLMIVPGAAGQARFRVPAEPFLALLAGAHWMRAGLSTPTRPGTKDVV